jgi:transposase
MDLLHALFIESLDLEYPFKLEKVDQQTLEGKTTSITFTIEIDIDYRPSKFHIKHSSYERSWQHLSMFQYPCFIKANLPVFLDKRTGKTEVIEVPWARKGSGFTLMFEHQVLELLRLTNCQKTTAKFFKIYPQRVRTIYDNYTLDRYEQREAQIAPKVGLDETSTKKGHDYISLFVNLETGQILDIQDGRSSQAVAAYANELKMLGKSIDSIKEFSLDMSPAFISGVQTHFTDARMTFDRFHVVQLINRYLKPLWKSKKVDKQLLEYHIKELDHLWIQPDCNEAAAFLTYWADRTKELFKMDSLCKSIYKHFRGIINFVESKVTNGLLEGMNSKIQFIKRAARGYRYTENFKRMILFAFGAL